MTCRLIALLILMLVLTGCEGNYKRKTSEFLSDINTSISPSDLQAWAQTEIAASSGNTVEITKLPAFLSASSDGPPQFAVVQHDGGDSFVQIYWGGGFGHWGLVVGDSSLKRTTDANNYYMTWKPGIYAWHEIQ